PGGGVWFLCVPAGGTWSLGGGANSGLETGRGGANSGPTTSSCGRFQSRLLVTTRPNAFIRRCDGTPRMSQPSSSSSFLAAFTERGETPKTDATQEALQVPVDLNPSSGQK